MATQNVPQSYEAFETQLKLLREFGPKALQTKLQMEAKNQGNTFKVDDSMVKNMFGTLVNQHMDSALASELNKVQKNLEQYQTPRGDNRPDVKNRQEGVVASAAQRFKNAPWMAKMDLAANTNIRDAFQNIANQINANPNASLTTQFNNVVNNLENSLRQEYANRLRMANKMQPRPGATAKPRPQ